MGVIQETLPAAALYNNPQQLIFTLTGAAALAATAKGALEYINQGEMGILLHRGQPVEREYEREWLLKKRPYTEEELEGLGRYVTRGPGLYGVVPVLQKYVKVNVQERTDQYQQGLDIESEDGQLFTTNPRFTWQVLPNGDNPYRALFRVKNDKDSKDVAKDFELQQTVLSVCVAGLGQVLEGRKSSDLKVIDRDEVSAQTEEVCRDRLLEYGSALIRVSLPSITRKDSEVLKQGLERNGTPNIGVIAGTAVEADASGMGAVIPFPFPRDAA